jgi:dienelactone hydrolase
MRAVLLCVVVKRLDAVVMDGDETVEFESRSVESYLALLAGVRQLPPVRVRGVLRQPQGTGPHPLVIVGVGSQGLASGREELYGAALLAQGIAVLIVDSFGSRGFGETVSNQALLSFPAQTADVLFALERMSKDARIDAGRIGFLGFSRAGQIAVFIDDERLHQAVIGGGARYAAFAAMYSGCNPQWRNPQPTGKPMLIYLGGADTLAPAEKCQRYAERLRQAGGDVRTIVLPEAHHSFDSLQPATRHDNVLVLAGCELRVEDDGVIVEDKSGLRSQSDWASFLKEAEAACGCRGATTGHGPHPRDIAVNDVVAFFKAALRA